MMEMRETRKGKEHNSLSRLVVLGQLRGHVLGLVVKHHLVRHKPTIRELVASRKIK